MKGKVGTIVNLPLDAEMSRLLAEAIAEVIREGYGIVELDVTPQAVKIAKKSIRRVPWPKKQN